mmetsp:Transcript_7944/g.21763  ORF Transcript_7944/g.21763 Transcript_7944/m.21763 type:complete len:279 (-) Transcript_7944:321-1157(-)
MSYAESLAQLLPAAPSACATKWLLISLAVVLVFKIVAKRACGGHCCRSTPKDLKLTYFDVPGRAEVLRLALAVGGIKYVDERLSRDEWAVKKEITPFGQLPVLEANGETLAQSHAILRYVGRLARLYPCSSWLSAKADEIVFLVEEMNGLIAPTFTMDAEAKVIARRDLAEGKLAKLWEILEARLEDKTFFVGTKLTVADLAVFCQAGILSSGWLDGINKNFLARFSRVQKHRAMVATLPSVQAFYKQLPETTLKAYVRMGIDIAAFDAPTKVQQTNA